MDGMRKEDSLEIFVKSTYCQLFIIEIIAKCLRRWGWKITTTSNEIKGVYVYAEPNKNH